MADEFDQIIRCLEEAEEMVAGARLKISDANLVLMRADYMGNSSQRELAQIQSHLQLSTIHIDELAREFRARKETV